MAAAPKFKHENQQRGWEKLQALVGGGQVPHYSILKDTEVAAAILLSYNVYFLRDNIGNEYVFGQFGEDYGGVFGQMFVNGVFRQSQIAEKFLGLEDDGGLERGVEKALYEFPRGNLKGWLQQMEYNETTGRKFNEPVLYIYQDPDAWTWSGIADELGALAALIIVGLSGGTLAPLALSIKEVTQNLVSGKPVTFADFGKVLELLPFDTFLPKEYTGAFEDAKSGLKDVLKKKAGVSIEDLSVLSNTASAAYTAYRSSDIIGIAQAFGYNSLSGETDFPEILNLGLGLYESLQKGDYEAIAKEAGLDKEKVGVMVNQMEYAQMIEDLGTKYRGVQLDWEKRKIVDEVAKGAIDVSQVIETEILKHPTFQQFSAFTLSNAYTPTKGLTAALPNAPVMLKLAYENLAMTTEEKQALINMFQPSQNVVPENLKRVVYSAQLESAKVLEEAGGVFNVPANLPPLVQIELGKFIRRYSNVKIESANAAVKRAIRNDKEFI